jgi:dsRNA-specific ribonuclease
MLSNTMEAMIGALFLDGGFGTGARVCAVT